MCIVILIFKFYSLQFVLHHESDLDTSIYVCLFLFIVHTTSTTGAVIYSHILLTNNYLHSLNRAIKQTTAIVTMQ